MDLYQDVFFRALDFARGRRNVRRLRFLRQSQYWDGNRLRDWQLRHLSVLLNQARGHSEFYRERLAGIELPLRSLRQLETIPILSKADIRAHGAAIRARNIGRYRFVPARTGGSTGEPMHYFWDKRAMDWNRGTVYRSAEWAGAALGQRAFQMSGSHFDYAQSQKLAQRLAHFLLRYRDLSVAWVSEELLETYFRQLLKFRPTSVWGYASGVALFADHIARRHPRADVSFVRAVLTSSETLSSEQRSTIERVFGAGSVFDNYGSREMYIAAECAEHHGYHLHADVVITEIVDAGGRACPPGERGRVVLTELFNHAFPFIRYEIGDLAAVAPAGECRCGVRLPRLERLEGRIAELVIVGDRTLTPPNFATLFSDRPGISAYQIVQKAENHLRVVIEPGEGFDVSTLEYIHDGMSRLVDGRARIEIVTDEAIAVPESGKRRFVISEVGQGARSRHGGPADSHGVDTPAASRIA